jgi:hypothetical protein
LYPEDSLTLLAQDDGPPVSVERATLTWDDPNELFIGRNILLTVPKTLKPGAYRLVIGLYDYVTGQRLLNESGQDSFSIEITVAP